MTKAAGDIIFAGMTTILQNNGHIVLPPKVRREKKLRPGDNLEVLADEDDPNAIVLRKVEKEPKPNWAEVLLACPEKGWFRPMRRRKEPIRKVRL